MSDSLDQAAQDSLAAELIAYIESNVTEIDLEKRFDAMLDECYSFKNIGGPFAYMNPSDVLREVDPTQYRIGVSEMTEEEGIFEINNSYYDGEEVEKYKEEFKDDLESAASDLEEEIEELKEEIEEFIKDNPGVNNEGIIEEKLAKERELATLLLKVEFVSDYSF